MRILLLAACLLLGVSAMSAQDDITLTPFTDEAFGISGVVPEGWTKAAPGVYARQSSATDGVSLIQQAAPGSSEAIVASLLPRLGLSELPESASTVETDVLAWTLYEIEVPVGELTIVVDLALAEANGKTYLTLLQATSDEHDALHESVFLPALDALTPLTTAEATPEATADVPYSAEDVTFENGDVTLAGTLTLPEGDGPHPAVVLITGSGAQDRDESISPISTMKPFALIADYLTREGIAVLRYDDRGVGGSTGDPNTTTADIASDAGAAIDYLLTRDEINAEQIGILGHSQGGGAAAMLGANNPNVAFIVGMAAPAVSGYEFLAAQNERLLQLAGQSETAIADYMVVYRAFLDAVLGDDENTLREATQALVRLQLGNLTPEQAASLGDLDTAVANITEQQIAAIDTIREIVEYNAGADWATVTVPVLGLFGGLDSQVIAEQNSPALEAALELAGNADYEIVTFPNANHLFQEAEKGGVDEYGTLPPVFTPDFLPTIADWLKAHLSMA